MPKLHTKSLQRLIDEFVPNPSSGCEVGVWTGHNSYWLLRSNPTLHLLMVDAYTLPDKRDWPKRTMSIQDMRDALVEALSMTDVYSLRRSFVIGYSISTANRIHDSSLDFVYLDGSHQAEAISADLIAWFPKVRIGGLIAGHDYSGRFPVKKVVDKFVESVGGTVHAKAGRVWGMQKER